jgi:hypothetical protein
MARVEAEMEVITKAYDLIVWSSQHLARFPRSHRFTLGDRLAHRLYDVLELLIRARYERERAATLKSVNLELELLRFQFRLAKDLKCLSLESYGAAARALNEVGRLVGGWLKQTAARTAPPPGAAGRSSHETTR